MFARAHLQTALQLVRSYQGDMPFVHFLKQYFSTHKKHGSRDRKQIAQLCYGWFRLGFAARDMEGEARMQLALFLCSDSPNPLLEALHPEWNSKATTPLREKLEQLDLAGMIPAIFPWSDQLSESIDPESFALSHLQQPDLFLRIRPGYQLSVLRKLDKLTASYRCETGTAIRLPNGFPVEDHFQLNREVVVQDLNSQRVGELLDLVAPDLRAMDSARVWDCCAASGGKTLMAFDRMPGLNYTVTDIRSSILQNLLQRFRQAGIYSYEGFVTDMAAADPGAASEKFRNLPPQDLVITDVPCSGSGTWGRTPEQLCFFDPHSVGHYSELQKKILSNAVRKLAPAGYLLYITCSVFRGENEDNLEWLLQNHALELVDNRIFKGYDQKADTMFAALLKRKS